VRRVDVKTVAAQLVSDFADGPPPSASIRRATSAGSRFTTRTPAEARAA
jgi:hypothetical protein